MCPLVGTPRIGPHLMPSDIFLNRSSWEEKKKLKENVKKCISVTPAPTVDDGNSGLASQMFPDWMEQPMRGLVRGATSSRVCRESAVEPTASLLIDRENSQRHRQPRAPENYESNLGADN